MIFTRTPFRISLFGGGTDYPQWYKEHGGVVLSTTIDKYCYITCRRRIPFHDKKYRLMYAQVENVDNLLDIKHPVVREALRFYHIVDGLEIHHDADLPAWSGIGSSSAFAVGLVSALFSLKRRHFHPELLASEATFIERDIVGDFVGDQDQLAVAHGGFNLINFYPKIGNIVRGSTLLDYQAQKFCLQENMMLFYTKRQRSSSVVSSGMSFDEKALSFIQTLPEKAMSYIKSGDFESVGRLMHESWCAKKQLNSSSSNDRIDGIYNRALDAGAYGGKILGAGGGGFMLLIANPFKQRQIIEALQEEAIHVPFKFEEKGNQVVFNDEWCSI